MRRPTDLHAADFPGVDPKKFEEWQEAFSQMAKAGKGTLWIPGLLFGLLILERATDFSFTWVLIWVVLIGGLARIAILGIPPAIRAHRLKKEMGLTREAIEIALKA